MLVTRGRNLLRAIQLSKSNRYNQIQHRNSSHACSYREGPKNPKYPTVFAEVIGGVMWWWILWHVWTEPGHLFGEFEYPDSRKWTDEELGIPPY